ncbi:MAG: chemotaxis-specific protein-glutamate methyltransferase CheB [Planctomycetes bacterium]|nr:chemotaxis-specific protein-glutamate methyltransferase CheB [Planctomycetota bacterium]
MRRMLGRTLTEFGFEVFEAENGRDALDRLQGTSPPQLMLVDWNMPEMNGLEFVTAVRERPEFSETRILMVTTESGLDRVRGALQGGANEYLMKPFTTESLRSKIALLGFEPAARSVAPPPKAVAPLKVLLVDDSTVVRRVVSSALASEQDIKLEVATNGQEGLDKIASWSPDLVLLDIEMPVMDGLTTLRELRKTNRTLPVIMFSTLTERGATMTLTALSAGASAYIAKPEGTASLNAAIHELRIALVEQIRSLCPRGGSTGTLVATSTASPPKPRTPARPLADRSIDVIAIASSTGGPVALTSVLTKLPQNLNVPVLVVQHMPELFTGLLANSLDSKSPLSIAEGKDGALVDPGHVWLAPGGLHMEVRRNGAEVNLITHDGPKEQSVRPAADVMFRSIAEVYGGNVLAVVLTGMGRDGLAGCEAIAAAGGQIIVQDEATSVVWGMPGFVANAGLAEAILPIDSIADEIVRRTSHAKSAQPATQG